MRRDVFQGIADPTRRAIINLIARKPLNLNAVAENFDVSRPAVSRHIKILVQCGLVVVTRQGRERYCQVNLRQLQQVNDWIEPYREFWTGKLNALGTFLSKEPVKTKRKPFKSKSK
jgi:DNA-binding transcriptional ArsR family regulator